MILKMKLKNRYVYEKLYLEYLFDGYKYFIYKVMVLEKHNVPFSNDGAG